MKWIFTASLLLCIGTFLTSTVGQDANRIKIAQGEYTVSTDEELGVGPIETEVFHFRESWTLWREPDGNYEVEGTRTFESPRGKLHNDRFWAQLTKDLRPIQLKEFTQLRWRPDSGPLTCDLLPEEMRCNSGGRDPARALNIQIALQPPYGIIWPISVFSLGHLAYVAAQREGQKVPVDLITINEFSKSLPVATIRSHGSIRYLGKSDKKFTASDTSWYPRVFELISDRTRTIHIWTSREGLVLAIERAEWPKTTMRLVSLEQFAEFPRGE